MPPETFDFEARDREEQERVRWRNTVRAEAGFSPYVIDPVRERRFQFHWEQQLQERNREQALRDLERARAYGDGYAERRALGRLRDL
jgi:hypothetical protein